MAAAASLKSPKIAISQQRFDRSPRNLALVRNSALMTNPTVRNLLILKIQDGGGHFEKSKNRRIAAADSAILTKFGTVTQFDPS